MLNNLTPDEAQNLRNYVASIGAELTRIEAHASEPIGDEYCWMHDGDGNGGWTCRECRQRAEARARRRDFIRLMRRPEMTAFREALIYLVRDECVALADIRELTVEQDLCDDCHFYQIILTVNESSDNILVMGHRSSHSMEWDFTGIDIKSFVESYGLNYEEWKQHPNTSEIAAVCMDA